MKQTRSNTKSRLNGQGPAEASASLTLAQQSTETTNKQSEEEDAATYGPLGTPVKSILQH